MRKVWRVQKICSGLAARAVSGGGVQLFVSLCALRNMLIMQSIVLHTALQGGRRAAGSDVRHGLQQGDTIS